MSKRLRSSEVCADCSVPGESLRRGPLPSALPTGTPAPGPPPRVRRLPAAEPHTPWPGSPLGGTGAALGREPSRACQSRAGRGPPPSLSSGPSCPRPCGKGAVSGPGPLLQQEGAWAMHRKANYRSKMRASSQLRSPEVQVSPPLPRHPPPSQSPAAPPGNPARSGFPSPVPPPKPAPGPGDDFPPPDIPAPPPRERISRTPGVWHAHPALRSQCVSQDLASERPELQVDFASE